MSQLLTTTALKTVQQTQDCGSRAWVGVRGLGGGAGGGGERRRVGGSFTREEGSVTMVGRDGRCGPLGGGQLAC